MGSITFFLSRKAISRSRQFVWKKEYFDYFLWLFPFALLFPCPLSVSLLRSPVNVKSPRSRFGHPGEGE
jgi:hypothetical protein